MKHYLLPLAIAACLSLNLSATYAAARPVAGETAPEPSSNPRTALKFNALAVVGIVNPAIEVALSPHISLQMDAMGAFYYRNCLGTGVPLTLATTFLEGRYYLRQAFRGLYAGPNLGYGVWKMNKDIAPGYSYGHSSVQYGSNVMMGLSVGYQWVLSPRWSLDFLWGLGWQHAIYEGYSAGTTIYVQDADGQYVPLSQTTYLVNGTVATPTSEAYLPYRDSSISADALNKSSEWMPVYKGGLFVTYRF